RSAKASISVSTANASSSDPARVGGAVESLLSGSFGAPARRPVFFVRLQSIPSPTCRALMVPHLTTALAGPLQDPEQRFLDRMPDIERWLRTHWQEYGVPFYASVDLRNAGFKLAPVDTNLFPGGFNNLNPAFLPLCVQAIQAAVERVCPDARGVLLVPENHTRNTFYLKN